MALSEEVKFTIKTWWLSVLLGFLAVYFVVDRGHFTFVDGADLFLHRVGHTVFAFFGEFLRNAGGTVSQIVIPTLVVFGFMKGDYRPGVQVSLFWLGHNMINISVYASDARRQISSMGARDKVHDWNYMLEILDLLRYDSLFGFFFLGIAVVVFAAMVLAPKGVP